MLFASKIVLCGDVAVGKTSLKNNFFGRGFNSSYIATIGADVSILRYQYKKNGSFNFKYSIWDLAGQQSWFNDVLPNFFRGAHGIIIVYDITNRKSFDNVINWLTGIIQHLELNDKAIVLVGNKIDLQREISFDDSMRLAQKISKLFFNEKKIIPIVETSAKTGENVEKVLEEITGHLIQIDQQLKE
ncbi:MAG: Rab family GTPase [Candidatus Thorarchaeota archaeon]